MLKKTNDYLVEIHLYRFCFNKLIILMNVRMLPINKFDV